MDAQGALDSLLGRLTTILIEEARLPGGVRGYVEFIRDEMECMNSLLLQLTEAQRRSHQVRTWMKQVAGLTRDCGGHVELYLIHYAGGNDGTGVLGFLRRINRFLRTIRARHHIAARIRELKVRARDVGDRRQRYGVVTVDAVPLQRDHHHRTIIINDKQPAASGLEEDDDDHRRRELLFGGEPPDTIEEGAKRLLRWLCEPREERQNTRIIWITGDGAVGKTAIARRVYQHPDVAASFQLRLWINIRGDHDMHPRTIAQEILKQTLPHQTFSDKATTEHLRGKKLLIVLDADWDDGSNGRRVHDLCGQVLSSAAAGTAVIYSGRQRAMYYHRNLYEFNVHKEEGIRPWFYKHRAHQLAKCSFDQIDRVLTECHPDTFALQMFLHQLYVQPARSEDELLRLHDNLKRNRSNIAKTMLMFCYDQLPINYKSCLLYLSVFPQDHTIRRTSLTRRWIAEGLIAAATARDKGSNIKSLEDQAQQVFDALVARGFVRPGEISTSGKIKTCTVHHTVHEFITTDVSLVDTCLPPELAYRLSMNCGMALQDASSSDRPFDDVTQTLLQSMPQSPQWKLLKVLDLEGCRGLKQKHMKNICKILLLRYLSLRNTDVTQLPKQIEKLQCLETLDIRQTDIKAFSTKSVTLSMLKYFLAGNKVPPPDNSPDRFQESFRTVRLPSGVRRMKKIEVLSCIEVSNNNLDDLNDIGELLQLRKLGVVLDSKKGGLILLFKQIEKLHACLQSLSIRVNQSIISEKNAPDAEVVPTLVTPPKLLESLNICGITLTSGFPQWIADLDRLSKITLQDTFLGEDVVRVLGKLRMLHCLRLLRKSYSESKLHFRAEEFQRLRFLVVEGSDTTSIIFHTGAAPKLEIIVWSFATMDALSGVGNLPRLKKLELNGDCDLDPVKAAIAEHSNHPDLKHIPSCHEGDGTAVAASSSSAL